MLCCLGVSPKAGLSQLLLLIITVVITPAMFINMLYPIDWGSMTYMIIPEKWKSNFRQNSECDIIKHCWNTVIKVNVIIKKKDILWQFNQSLGNYRLFVLTDQNLPMEKYPTLIFLKSALVFNSFLLAFNLQEAFYFFWSCIEDKGKALFHQHCFRIFCRFKLQGETAIAYVCERMDVHWQSRSAENMQDISGISEGSLPVTWGSRRNPVSGLCREVLELVWCWFSGQTLNLALAKSSVLHRLCSHVGAGHLHLGEAWGFALGMHWDWRRDNALGGDCPVLLTSFAFFF